jgi:hypothetical protein
LLNKWITRGFLKRVKPVPLRRRGITRQEAIAFLNRLTKAEKDSRYGIVEYHPRAAGRPQSAMRAIRLAGLPRGVGNGMTPREFSAKVGVSRASVMRAIKVGVLPAWKPTPRRFVVGEGPRNQKKFAKSEKFRLTR